MTYESEFLGDLMWLAVPAGDDDITDKRRRSDSGLTQTTLWLSRAPPRCTLSHRTSSLLTRTAFYLSTILSLKTDHSQEGVLLSKRLYL